VLQYSVSCNFRRIVKFNLAGHPVLKFLPSNVTIVPEIEYFSPPGPSIATSRIEFANGTVRPQSYYELEMLTVSRRQTLNGIDSIIFATGYRHSLPFLPQFHNSSRTAKDS
jgi:hypothetical protein